LDLVLGGLSVAVAPSWLLSVPFLPHLLPNRGLRIVSDRSVLGAIADVPSLSGAPSMVFSCVI
jgi:hypothetical protein